MQYKAQHHTFVICAYQENPYLEKCISSVMGQTVLGNVLISTATPNDYISNLARKYSIPVVVNTNANRAILNWNFGYEQAQTPLVTICHQDDYYYPDFLRETLSAASRSKKPLLLFTDYDEVRVEEITHQNTLLKIKRLMLSPLKDPTFQRSRFIRRLVLSLGDPICCPSVTLNKELIPEPPFTDLMKCCQDWDAWERISKLSGSFVYCPKPLMVHRIWEESITSTMIIDGTRSREELEMFCRFWPKPIAVGIQNIYRAAQKSNNTGG